MLETLLPYYERELAALRQLGGEFARRYPKIARRLLLEGDQCEDPHVERLIEAFAFLAARVQRKLDDEFPEISEAFLQILYPHYTRPFPSWTILQFELDAAAPQIGQRYHLPRHQQVLSPPVGGIACRFRTCYPVDLYPLTLYSARLEHVQSSEHLRRLAPEAAAALTLDFRTQGGLPVNAIGLTRLRFFLDGEPGLMHLLYELLLTRTLALRVSDAADDPGRTTQLPAEAVAPVGFAPEEAMLDHDDRSFPGYLLLTEYFACPEKFLFLDLQDLEPAAGRLTGNELRIRIFLSSYGDGERHVRLMQSLDAANLKLGCTPAINLFRQPAEPVRLTHHRTSYPVIPDGRRPLAYEVIAIDAVTAVEKTDAMESTRRVPPFYSVCHNGTAADEGAFWYATREPSTRENDRGTEVEIVFTDLNFRPTRPATEVLSLELTCSNRDLPEQIPFGGSAAGAHTDFTLPGNTVVQRVRPLRKPTPTLRPPAKRGLYWRLISHLALNHLSLVAGEGEPLREMLSLYDLGRDQSGKRQIQGIVAVEARPGVARVSAPHFAGFVRGVDITLTVDENAFVGAGTYLFGSVLERFFALYCSVNSFTRLHLHSKQQGREIAQWPARAGQAIVI